MVIFTPLIRGLVSGKRMNVKRLSRQ